MGYTSVLSNCNSNTSNNDKNFIKIAQGIHLSGVCIFRNWVKFSVF